MLYLHENTYPFPGVMDEYVKVMETDLIPGLNRHMRVMGVFRVAFRHRETFFLSELPKGVDRAHYMAYKGMAAAAAPKRLDGRETRI